jgi:hypothetical protein
VRNARADHQKKLKRAREEKNHPVQVGRFAVLDILLLCLGEVMDRGLIDGDVDRQRDTAGQLVPIGTWA